MQLALIHTSPSMIPVFKALTDALLPGLPVFNMVDESLLCDIIREKGCPPLTARRLVNHVLSAESAGATHIMVTCSSMGRAVEASRAICGAKVYRVDEAMADRAIATGAKIGVIATLPSTLAPTVELIHSRAGTPTVQVESSVVDGAFQAVISGDGATHDRLVSETLRSLARQVDVIVLAQASMARVVESLPPEDKRVPILSSPRLAIEHLAKVLGSG